MREYIARGMDLELARTAALARLGDIERVRSEASVNEDLGRFWKRWLLGADSIVHFR